MHPTEGYTPAVYTTMLTYEKNGVKKEFTPEEFNKQKIWEDPSWKYDTTISILIKEAIGEPEIHDFVLTGLDGEDHTKDVLNAKGYTFFWFVREPLKDIDPKSLDRIRNIATKAATMHVNFYVLCSAGPDLCKTYQEVWNMKDVTFFTLDQVASKTALRTNPGLMLINDGIVVNKWSNVDYPKDIVLDNGKLDCK